MAKLSRDYLAKAAPVEPLFHAGRMVARITCSQCGSKEEWAIAHSKPPPDILGKHFSNKGWYVRKRPLCPSCCVQSDPSADDRPKVESDPPATNLPLAAALRRALTEKKETTPMSNVAPLKTEQAPTEAVKAARRKANEFLMFHFDVEKGRYEDGWSDERVAKDSGMPVAWVVKRREEEYGALKQPSEFAEIRAQAAALASEIGKLNARLEILRRENGWSA